VPWGTLSESLDRYVVMPRKAADETCDRLRGLGMMSMEPQPPRCSGPQANTSTLNGICSGWLLFPSSCDRVIHSCTSTFSGPGVAAKDPVFADNSGAAGPNAGIGGPIAQLRRRLSPQITGLAGSKAQVSTSLISPVEAYVRGGCGSTSAYPMIAHIQRFLTTLLQASARGQIRKASPRKPKSTRGWS
jgi:hypothetical protein